MNSTPIKILLVMGMHRSGTSAMTRLLNLMGAHLGDNIIPPKEGINSKGFWEYQEVVSFNESLLASLGLTWYDVYSTPAKEWWRSPLIQEKKPELKSILLSLVSEEHNLYVIKDPRLCLTYPLWDEVISELGWEHHCFMVTRDPREVALSLLKREGFSIDTSYLLWKRYFQAAISALNYAPHLILPYNTLISNPVLTAELIATNLPELQANFEDKDQTEIESEIDRGLKHHSAMDMTHSEFESKLVEIYELSLSQVSLSSSTLKEILLRLNYAESLLDAEFYKHFNSKLIHNTLNSRKILIEIGDELSYARDIVRERDEQLSTKNDAIETLQASNQEFQVINQSIQTSNDEFEVINQTIEQKNVALEENLIIQKESLLTLQETNQSMQQDNESQSAQIDLLNDRLYSMHSDIKIVIITDYFVSLFREVYYFIRPLPRRFKNLLQKAN